jgi:hypothetical protein
MISQVTTVILVFFTLVFGVVIMAFILLVRFGSERPGRYNPRRQDRRRGGASSGYNTYRDGPEIQNRRRESAIVIGIIILFIIISLLSFYL